MESDSHERPRLLVFRQFSIFGLLVIVTIFAIVVAIFASLKRRQERKISATIFAAAVEGGNLEKVDELLKFDPSLAHGRKHYGVEWNWTALQMAAHSPVVFDRILEENPDLEEPAKNGVTALTRVAQEARIVGADVIQPMIKELIKLGANVNGADPTGDWASTPIEGAAYGAEYGEGVRNIELLLEAGADVGTNHRSDGQTCVHLAVGSENKEAIRVLIEAGADVNAKDKNGDTPLHLAMKNDWLPIARTLISHGADLVAKENHNRIPGEGYGNNNSLMFDAIKVAHERGDFSKVDEMLESAPQVLNWTTPSPMLVQATFCGRLDIMDYLLAKGANPGIVYDAERAPKVTVLHALAGAQKHREKNAEVLARLDRAGVDVDKPDGRGRTPLYVAVEQHNQPMLDALIEIGADVNARNSRGRTPLHVAAESYQGHLMLKTLNALGADVNAKDSSGRTPLHVAAKHLRAPMLSGLLAIGADVHTCDAKGTSVMDLAFLTQFNAGMGRSHIFFMAGTEHKTNNESERQMLAILRQAGHERSSLFAAATGNIQLLEAFDKADLLTGKTEKQITPLDIAVISQQVGAVKWLLSHGADPNARNPKPRKGLNDPSFAENESLLMMALGRGYSDVAVALIEGGADANGPLTWLGPPLHIVIENGFDPKVFQALLDHGADETAVHQGMSVRQCAVQRTRRGDSRSQKYLKLLDAHTQKAE